MDDFLDRFNLISRLLGIAPFLATFVPIRRSRKGRKVGPYVVDPSMWEIRIARGNHWTGAYTEHFLNQRWIAVSDPKRVTDCCFIMCVHRRQAKWAEYQLCRAGAPFHESYTWFDARNAAWAARYNTPVPMWGDRHAN